MLKTDPQDLIITVSDINGLSTDEMIIGFSEEATDEFDGLLDMWKFLNMEDVSTIYSLKGNQSFAINRIAEFEDHKAVRAGFRNGNSGTYFINADLSEIAPTYSVELEDLKLRKFHNLRSSAYKFWHDKQGSIDRFIIHINKNGKFISEKAGKLEELVFIYGNSEGIVIDFSLALAGQKEIAIHDITGRLLANSLAKEDEAQVVVPIKICQSAYVIVQINGETWVLNQKVFIGQ